MCTPTEEAVRTQIDSQNEHHLPQESRPLDNDFERQLDDDLERCADMLLRLHGPDPEYPHVPDVEWHSYPMHSLDDPHDPVAREARRRARPTEAPPEALQAMISGLLVEAGLVNRDQRRVARLRLWGYRIREIAQLLGLPPTTVQTRWRYARRRLLAALAERSAEAALASPGTGCLDSEQLRLLFSAEQRKQLYCPPRHCPRGSERCQRTGVCVRR